MPYLVIHRGWGAVAAVDDRVEVEFPGGAAARSILHLEKLVKIRHGVHFGVGGVAAVRRIVEGNGGLYELVGAEVGLCWFRWAQGAGGGA